MTKLTPALVRAMVAVRAGKVTQVYTAKGNTFEGPAGIAVQSYRRLETAKWIEDAPESRSGVFKTRFVQRLTAAGRAALEPGQ